MTERLDKVVGMLKGIEMELILLSYDLIDNAERDGQLTFEKANELRAEVDAKLPVQPSDIGEA